MQIKNRVLGSLYGVAVGDALGVPLEFRKRDTIHVDRMVGGGRHCLKPGQYTDDTSMMLCICKSISDNGGKIVNEEIMGNFLKWRDTGFMSSNGKCFDIGKQTAKALSSWKNKTEISSVSDSNGALMRIAPVVIAVILSGSSPEEVIEHTKLTHPSTLCIETSLRLYGYIKDIFEGKEKVFTNIPRDKISSSGYAVDTLEAALWAFEATDNFRDGAILAVNLGDDADTVGAVYGSIAGAYYGINGIPNDWLRSVKQWGELQKAIDNFTSIQCMEQKAIK